MPRDTAEAPRALEERPADLREIGGSPVADLGYSTANEFLDPGG